MANEGRLSTTAGPSSVNGERIAKIGTVISAILASSCCWLPLLLLAVGVSGAGIASTLGAYRPIFMVVTFTFLGMAFYFTYRPRRVAVAEGQTDCCAPQADCCAPKTDAATKGRRFNMMAVNKVMLWVVAIMAVAFLFFPKYLTSMLAGDGGEFTANMTRTTLTVEGMTCEGCVPPAIKAIRETPGVLAVKLDYSTQTATVGTAPDQPVAREAILLSLKEVGFSGKFTDSEFNS